LGLPGGATAHPAQRFKPKEPGESRPGTRFGHQGVRPLAGMRGDSLPPAPTAAGHSRWPKALRSVVPNAITACGMAVGAYMIAYGDFRWELFVLTLALDVADGAAARALDAATDFGAVMDSCADAVNFAIGPALLLPQASLLGRGLFAASGLVRLAAFTAGHYQDAREGVFVGVPTPLASGLVYAAAAVQDTFGVPVLDAALLLCAVLEHAPLRLPKLLGAGGLTLTPKGE